MRDQKKEEQESLGGDERPRRSLQPSPAETPELSHAAPKGAFGYCAICYHPLDKCSHCDTVESPQSADVRRPAIRVNAENNANGAYVCVARQFGGFWISVGEDNAEQEAWFSADEARKIAEAMLGSDTQVSPEHSDATRRSEAL